MLVRFFTGTTRSAAAGTGASTGAGTPSAAASAAVLGIAVSAVTGIYPPVMMYVIASAADKAPPAVIGNVAIHNVDLRNDQQSGKEDRHDPYPPQGILQLVIGVIVVKGVEFHRFSGGEGPFPIVNLYACF